ncbi:MAG: hypothetical protein ACP5O7_12810, partial [Phycisphaerae bacterium]
RPLDPQSTGQNDKTIHSQWFSHHPKTDVDVNVDNDAHQKAQRPLAKVREERLDRGNPAPDIGADLAGVIHAWPSLPTHICLAVLALVQSAGSHCTKLNPAESNP